MRPEFRTWLHRPGRSPAALTEAPGWTVELTATEREAGRWDLVIEVGYTGEQDAKAGLSLEVGLPADGAPHFLIPGLFYGENRPSECTRLYPRFVADNGDPARFESSAWAFRADRAATPVVFAWTGSEGLALATTEVSGLGLAGLGFAATADGPVVRLYWPYREEPMVYDGAQQPRPPDTPARRWHPGDRVRLVASCYLLSADRHGYATVLRDLHARTPVAAASPAWVSPAEAAELAAEGLYRWHYRAEHGVLAETAAFDREFNANVGGLGDRAAMHVSWVSGVPYAWALLRHGRRRDVARYVEAGGHVLDTIAANLTPAGTFWGQWTSSGGWNVGWTPDRTRLHARTLADATTFMVRAVAGEREIGIDRAAWARAARSTMEVALAAQREDGNLGSAYHRDTGEVLSWAGAAGLAWIPALVEASAVFDEPRYLDAAVLAGRHYRRFLDAEFVHGAPEDVDLAPTSEDGYLAVMAYVALAERHEDPMWWRSAARAADWMLTFRYSYDVAFDRRTLLGRYGFRTRGADQASPCNQHLHSFGLICLPELVRLARRTSDPYYLAAARENLACFRQFVARVDGDFNAYRGMVSERFYQTECFQPKGMLLTLSHAWCVGVLLYACDEAAEFPELTTAERR